jgi:hypothetical protein
LLKNSSPPTADPLPNLVQSRFRLLKECAGCDDQNDDHIIERRLDEVQRRARKLDERIVRTVATSTSGLLAQVNLLAAFYEASFKGAGRRGSLLIQTIMAGIERLDRLNQPLRYRTTGTRTIRKSGSTETAFTATRKTAINRGVNTKRVRPMKANEIGSDAW